MQGTGRASAGLGLLLLVACGGRVAASEEAVDASAEGPGPSPVDCSLSTLVASPPTTLASYTVPTDSSTGQPGPFVTLTAATTAAGDVVLVSLASGASASLTVVRLGASGATASSLVAVPAGQAAYDGQDLLVIYGSQSDGIGVQRVGTDGSLAGAPVTGLGGPVFAAALVLSYSRGSLVNALVALAVLM